MMQQPRSLVLCRPTASWCQLRGWLKGTGHCSRCPPLTRMGQPEDISLSCRKRSGCGVQWSRVVSGFPTGQSAISSHIMGKSRDWICLWRFQSPWTPAFIGLACPALDIILLSFITWQKLALRRQTLQVWLGWLLPNLSPCPCPEPPCPPHPQPWIHLPCYSQHVFSKMQLWSLPSCFKNSSVAPHHLE